MSDVENDALTGADAAPAPEEIVQETPQTPAPVETDEQREEAARDEKGRFVQKRINELTREKYEARRQAESLQQRLQQLEQEVSQYRQPQAPDPQQDPEGFIAHLAREEARRLIDSERSQWSQQQEEQRFHALASDYGQRAEAFAQTAPDFAEAAANFGQIIGENYAVAEVLFSSEHGPAVVHYLGTHLDEAAKVASLPPHLAAAHLARIEARVAAPKPKPVTHAPAPAPTVGGGSTLPGVRDGMDYEAYKAARLRG